MNNELNNNIVRLAHLLNDKENFAALQTVIDADCWGDDAVSAVWDGASKYYREYGEVPTVAILQELVSAIKSKKVNVKGALKVIEELPAVPLEHGKYTLNEFKKEIERQYIDNVLKDVYVSRDIEKAAVTYRTFKAGLYGEHDDECIDWEKLEARDTSHPACLWNNWVFEVGDVLIFNAPTGSGKSVFVTQLGFFCALGKAMCGITPHRPLKVLCVQAEDSQEVLTRLRDGALHGLKELSVSDEEIKQAFQNFKLIRLRGVSGKSFLIKLAQLAKTYSPNIIVVNPLSRFYGGDTLDPEKVTDFFNELEKIADDEQLGIVLVGHTKKQKESEDNPSITAHSGYGSAKWGDHAREVLELRKTSEEGLYELRSGKRRGLWGWDYYPLQLEQSANRELPLWTVRKSPLEILKTSVKNNNVEKTNATRDKILELVPFAPNYTTIVKLENLVKLTRKPITSYVRQLRESGKVDTVQEGRELRIFRVNPDETERPDAIETEE